MRSLALPDSSSVTATLCLTVLSCTSVVPVAGTTADTDAGSTGASNPTSTPDDPPGSDTAGVTSSSPLETDTSGDTETTSSPQPSPASLALEYAGPPSLQLGSVSSGSIIVSNVGDNPASELSPQAANLSILENNCEVTLDPGDECSLAIELFSPTLGPMSAGLVVAFHDGVGAAESSILLDMDVQGRTENLLADPSFEACATNESPPGWVDTGNGDWACLESWSGFQPYSGERMLAAREGAYRDGAFRLEYVFDLGPHANAIETGIAEIWVRGRVASAFGDQQRAEVLEWNRDLEGSGVLGTDFSATDAEWVEFDHRGFLSASSAFATLAFECLHGAVDAPGIPMCNGYFDAFDVRVVYPAGL